MSSLPFLSTLHFMVNHYNLTYIFSIIIPFSHIAVLSCQIIALPKSNICLLCLHNMAARDWRKTPNHNDCLTSSLWPWPQCAWSSAQKPQLVSPAESCSFFKKTNPSFLFSLRPFNTFSSSLSDDGLASLFTEKLEAIIIESSQIVVMHLPRSSRICIYIFFLISLSKG